MKKSLTELLARLLRTLRRVQPTAEAAEAAEQIAAEEPERLLGCGWFDSSHELLAGLSVREHASADTLGSEMPLTSWLDLQLAGWRAPQALLPAA